MDWAHGRQFLIWAILISIVAAIAAAVAFVIFYKVPSCTDTVQNQDERGVDCGGSCSIVCGIDVQAPEVLFVRPLEQTQGKTDIIAYIENRNTAAQTDAASYTVEMYDANNAVLASYAGRVKLPVSAGPIPLFIPAAYMGTQHATHAFLTFGDPIVWKTGSRVPPERQLSSEYALSNQNGLPRIIAAIHNPQPTSIQNLKVVVAVFDASNSVMAASQTVLREATAQGDTQATFTWNHAFPSIPGKVDVLPLYP